MYKAEERILRLEDLEGNWYIQYTNFPMWLKGDKLQPMFTYRIANRRSHLGLSDTVSYIKSGRTRTIKGFDVPQNGTNSRFEWRGNGLLRLLSSSWEILHITDSWMLIFFEKTLFTPAGYDVVSREKILTAPIQEEIDSCLEQMGITGLQRLSWPL